MFHKKIGWINNIALNKIKIEVGPDLNLYTPVYEI